MRLTLEEAVEKDEDGRIWLYLRDHKIDITGQIEKHSLGTDHHQFPDVEELRENTK